MADATLVDRLRAHPGYQADPFEHIGLLYRDPEQYVDGTTGFVRSALAAGDPVLVAVPRANVDLVREGLGADAELVTFADMSVAGRNPGRIIPGVLLDFAERHPDRRVTIIGEPIWPERSPIEYPACAAHEALINAAFAGRDAAILCPYDAGRLTADAIADAHVTHPIMMDERGDCFRSPDYAGPASAAARFSPPLPPPPADATTMAYTRPAELTEVRRFVVERATLLGLPPERGADLTVAVTELATNTLLHTDAGGLLTAWTEPDALVCQIDDTGHLTDPLAGRVPPPADLPRGRGLVLVNQLCDLVRVHTAPDHTTVRLYTYL